ncbi:hypothetical protein [Roseateles amylovorans]|uniref:Uncharacterized protein n=1 Tax=Roseateles amylovorans TaxID=2978473 RepID=A0ABY6AZB6_9BURK|nr:hypothetical protein [Roseateles amylovorans]UXH78032.1 hypothetical protein N4261_24250 [Roseateles amylovorans]
MNADRIKRLRDRKPLTGCDERTVVTLQQTWGMSEARVFGHRLGADALCVRTDLSVGSALANLRRVLMCSASMLAVIDENGHEGDPMRDAVSIVRELQREGLGMLGLIECGVDEEGREGAATISPPHAPAPSANDGAVAVTAATAAAA